MVKTTYPDGTFTANKYDAVGQVIEVTDVRGAVTRSEYDAAGRRTKITDALGRATVYTFDAVGNQLSVTDANGRKTSFEYDALDRRTKTIFPDTTEHKTTYNALGQVASKVDQAGKTTQFEYDKVGRLVKVTDAAGQVTAYAYDEVGNQISQTDANGHATRFEYDKLGRRVKRTLPLGMSEALAYDTAGRLLSRTDFNGKTTAYAYGAAGRLLTKTPDPSLNQPAATFTYTATGQRETMSDASGTTTYAYDARSRLETKQTPQGTLSYTYDEAGNLKSVRSSSLNGVSVNYTYDTLNRLETVVDNRLAATATYGYDAIGNLETVTYPNGVRSVYYQMPLIEHVLDEGREGPVVIVDLPALSGVVELLEDRRLGDEAQRPQVVTRDVGVVDDRAPVAVIVLVLTWHRAVCEDAVGERLDRPGSEPLVGDGVSLCERAGDRDVAAGARREILHDLLRVGRASVRRRVLAQVVCDEALHVCSLGLRAAPEDLLVHVFEQLAGVRVRHDRRVRAGRPLPHLDPFRVVRAGGIDRVRFVACEAVIVRLRLVRVEAAQHVVERTVLKHQHHDMFYAGQDGGERFILACHLGVSFER